MRRILFMYEQKDSLLHSLDPLSKLVWLACMFVLSFIFTRAVPQFVLLLSVILVGIVLARIAPRETGFLVIVFSLFSVEYFIIQTLLIGGQQVLFEMGPIPVAAEGLDVAGTVALRFLVLVSTARVFVGTTEPRDLALALVQKLGLPYTVAFSIFMLLRLLPYMEQEYADLRDARKVRGVQIKSGLMASIRNSKDYVVVLLARGFRRGVVTAYSLESRAFRAYSERTYVRFIEVQTKGKIFAVTTVCLSGLAIALNLIWV
jgi:energy-coupling factor transport system permease protein